MASTSRLSGTTEYLSVLLSRQLPDRLPLRRPELLASQAVQMRKARRELSLALAQSPHPSYSPLSSKQPLSILSSIVCLNKPHSTTAVPTQVQLVRYERREGKAASMLSSWFGLLMEAAIGQASSDMSVCDLDEEMVALRNLAEGVQDCLRARAGSGVSLSSWRADHGRRVRAHQHERHALARRPLLAPTPV